MQEELLAKMKAAEAKRLAKENAKMDEARAAAQRRINNIKKLKL